MTLKQRIIKCTKELNALFRKSIGPLAVFLFLYYLISQLIVFPIGRAIWSKALSTLPDGYIGLNNMEDVFSHPLVIVVGLILALLYCVLTFLQIECAFTFVEYRYKDRIIGFGTLVKDVVRNTIKVLRPGNWPMILLVVLAIPFVNLFSVTADISSIVVPEFIYTVIMQRTPYFIAYTIFRIILLYVVLKGLYVEITFRRSGSSFRQAYRDSAKLTKGFPGLLEKFCGLIITRGASVVLFSVIPSLLASAIHLVSKAIFGDSEVFKPVMEVLENNIAYPAIMAFCTAMSCAVCISLIVIWFHVDMEKAGESEPALQEYKTSRFVEKITRVFTTKVFAVALLICVVIYCILIFAGVNVLKDNKAFILEYSRQAEIIAHKGYTAKAPENTIPALEEAIECGNATMVEFDVQATKDGVPVVIHDENAKALTGVDKNIADMNLASVKKLDASYSFKNDKYENTSIPTLEEYLIANDHRIDMLLEIKNYNGDPELESNIMKLLEKYGYLDGSCRIHSGSIESLKKIKEINPDMQCGLIMTVAIGTFYDLSYADFYSVESSFVTPVTVVEIHKRSKPVYAWTVDEQSVVEEVYDADADGIICDDPDRVSGYIDEYAGDVIAYSSKRAAKMFNEFDDVKNAVRNEGKGKQINTEYGD